MTWKKCCRKEEGKQRKGKALHNGYICFLQCRVWVHFRVNWRKCESQMSDFWYQNSSQSFLYTIFNRTRPISYCLRTSNGCSWLLEYLWQLVSVKLDIWHSTNFTSRIIVLLIIISWSLSLDIKTKWISIAVAKFLTVTHLAFTREI